MGNEAQQVGLARITLSRVNEVSRLEGTNDCITPFEVIEGALTTL